VWRRDWFRLVITSALVLLLFGAGDDRARSQGSLAEANQLIVEVEALWGGYEQAAIDVKLRQALAIREAQLGPNHPLVADVIGRLGRNSWNQGDLNAAEQMFRRALNIFQQGGRDAFNIARLQGDLGATLREKGSYPEAEKLVRNSVAMRRGLNPPNPLFVAAGLDNLGRVLAAQRRLPEAKAAIEESLALRRSALSAQDVMVQQSETLLNALQDAIDPWRVVFRVGWILLVCVFGLVVVAGHNAHVARTGRYASFAKLHLPIILGCAAACGYVSFIIADVWLPLYLPEWGSRNLGRLRWLAGLLGFGGFLIVSAWTMHLARWFFGLPTLHAIEDPGVRRAILVGKIWVNWPAIVLLMGTVLLLAYGISQLPGGEPKGLVAMAGMIAVGVIGLSIGWLWWSIMIPRWQVWARAQVSDAEVLFGHAVGARLLHRTDRRLGRLFTRTEWWTPSLRRKAQELLAARRKLGQPSSDQGAVG
jgi:tetratricopeptide (TPR) repeat protein